VSTRAIPKQVATVILLRRAEPKGFEVFLTRRPDSMPFLGGMYCYPGGTVKKEDFSAAMVGRCFGLSRELARTIVGAQFSPERAIGIWIAGVRELFEEVGVLLAVEDSEDRLTVSSARAARLADKHRLMMSGAINFLSLIASENLRCDLSRLAYFSHWQTPAQVSTRFDTYFFLAAMPDDQTPLPISSEVAHSLWLTPDHALQRFSRGELPMIFPTFSSLRTLADFDTLDSVFKEYFRDRWQPSIGVTGSFTRER
jgi:8-oxo-dGTP pyrophosphatase MutT (NUDIX family)